MEDLIRQIAACSRQGERGALSSLVASSGSIPMSERAKMLVKEDGQILVDKSRKFQEELGQWTDPEAFLAT